MFNTKLEVDRHVENCLKKLNSEVERNTRCFAFAKLYFKIGEYEQARRYITMYLNVKPVSAEVQLLLGKTLEKLGKREQALEAYKTSLHLDPKQNSLIIKICELLASDDICFDQTGARYFCEKGQNLDPHNPAVFNLKEKIVASESKDPNEVSKLLIKELESRPTNIDIRIKLLKHLLDHNQIKEAYKHAYEIEQKHMSLFVGNLTWYKTVADVLIRYQRDITLSRNLTWEFWFTLISVLDKVVLLSLDERTINIKNTPECVLAVFNFDQTLKAASENILSCPEKHLLQEFLNHYRGQICFHLATLIYKQAKKELIPYKESTTLSLPLLFAAYHLQPADLQGMWLDHAAENYRKQVQKWHQEAAYRCSQAGHILVAAAKDRKSIVIEKATQGCSGMWREQIFKKLFVTRDQQAQIKTSFFTTCSLLTDILIRLPDMPTLTRYDEIAQYANPDSLHHYIWIGLNQKLSHFKCSIFEGLQFSIKHLTNCAAETLNVLDIQSFIYCAVLCAQSQIEDAKHSYNFNPNKPQVLPAAITDHLGTINQTKWLATAYKMYKNEHSSNYNELRLILVRGIEVIRCIGNHGLDVKLIVSLANIFSENAKSLTKHSEIEFTDARAELYWKAALPLLEKLRNNQAITYAPNRLFEYKSKEMSHSEILHHIDCGKLFNGIQLMKKKENEKALKLFEQLKDPYASFNQALIYKTMADEQTNQSKENLTSEMRSQNIILLSRARDYLYLTLDRLRDPAIDRQHPLNNLLGTEIEKVERLLSRIDPDISINRNECDGMSDENTSSVGSMPENLGVSYSIPNQSFFNGISPRQEMSTLHTPYRLETSFKREARPSPERLDAQLRQLAASKDAAINNILEQNKIMVESHRNLVDELRSFKDAVTTLTTTVNDLKAIKHTVEDLKGIKQSVDELKVAVDDLQNFRNISDVVYEMKKELQELKKDTTKVKTNQLSDEDLYVLEDEYGADYNINANPVAGLNPTLYPNFQGRLQGTNNLAYPPPALYTGMYPMYPYPGLGLAQPGGLPFADASQLPDFRVGAFPQPLTQTPQQTSYPQSIAALQQVAASPLTQGSLSQGSLGQSNLLQGQGLLYQPHLYKDGTPTGAGSLTTPGLAQISIPSFATSASQPIPANSSASKVPLNVVITASDPLPTTKTTSIQPILSVTIPPEHLKGNQQKNLQPHNYQISLPPSTSSSTLSTPAIMKQSPLPVSTQSLLSNIAPPIYSAITDNKTPQKNVGLGIQIEKSLSQSFNNSRTKDNSNASTASIEEHDPCPDFKPIIPLPDEVTVNTGEENETVLFCERAKLYRYTEKEWRERGVGEIKLLKNNNTGKIRVLMRREQVYKICANHFITKDMTLNLMPNSDKAYIWAANDFADEEFVLEKLCVKFKKPEEAQMFYNAFEKAKNSLPDDSNPNTPISKPKTIVSSSTEITTTPVKASEKSLASLGGFVFTSTPTFKPKEAAAPVTDITVSSEPLKSSPFASFSFASKVNASISPSFSTIITQKSESQRVQKQETATASKDNAGDGSHAEDFIPNVEFKPVVPLPELVDVKTGEENAQVLFEHRAKLLRYDTAAKEWKERGVGIMKILKENAIRFVMRREQVHKVCCNHQLLKNMCFQKMEKNSKAVTWYAKDFSEGELKNEMFAIKFKSEDVTDSFLEAIDSAIAMLDDNNQVKAISDDMHEEKKSDKKSKSDTTINVEPTSPTPKSNWGDKFKPKVGSWECKNCYIINDGKGNYCVACDTPKNDTIPKKSNESQSSGPQFSFGIAKSPAQTSLLEPKPSIETSSFIFGKKPETQPVSGWGDAFKAKTGSWECKECYLRNDADKIYCISCEAPKDETVPKKEANKGVSLDTGGLTFSFGMPATVTPAVPISTPAATSTFNFGTTSNTKPTGFSFGATTITNTSNVPSDAPLNLSSGKSTFNFKLNMPVDEVKPVDTESKDQFVFGSPQKHNFEFTPRSPRRHSSGHGEEESDGSYIDDDGDSIYFKPVIPLPDKIDVKTGEEEEEVIYCHRAKVFRFVQGEWKERGIGDIKILRMNSTNKLRVLMRREKILKICLNHILTSDIEYMPKDDKTWLFTAPDFSEGEILHEQFCLRFKTPEIAQEFKKAVEDALKTVTGKENKITKQDSEVEIISEMSVSKEEEQEAIRLMLPPKFMAYRQLPDCSCAQCKKDDEYLKELYSGKPRNVSHTTSNIFARGSLTSQTSPNKTIFGTPESTTKTPSTTTSEVFWTPSSTLSTPTATSDANKFSFSSSKDFAFKTPQNTTLKDLLNSPSLFATQTPPKPEGNTDVKTGFTFKLDSNITPIENNLSNSPLKTVEQGTPCESKPFSFSTQGNIFDAPTPSNIFGTPATTSTGSIFGSNLSIFGTNKPNTSIFGGANLATPIFGASTCRDANKTDEEKTDTGKNVFGSSSVSNISFGSLAAQSEIPSFGSVAEAEHVKTDQKDSDIVLKCDSNLSFSSLAAMNKDGPPAFAGKTDDKTPFAFLGAGAPVFGAGKSKPTPQKSGKHASGDEAEDEGGAGDEYDPHYEPIVPLPEAIVVSTGEEDETVLFNERSKVYRYDADLKEWKERGIGQLKILHHPEKNTYRLLLRREQVHKLVLNMLILPQLELQTMTTSDKAWCWVGHNYLDEPIVEKLAARFKTPEVAQKFYETVQTAVAAAKKAQDEKEKQIPLPSTVENYEHVGGGDSCDADYPNGDEEGDYDECEYDDNDERSIMFSSRCTLSEELPNNQWKTILEDGDLKVYYDPDFYGSCITAVDDTGLLVSKTIIGMNTVMAVEGNECCWRAVEWANDIFQWKNFKARFENVEEAQEFHLSYEEGLQYAEQCDIIDEIPREIPEADPRES